MTDNLLLLTDSYKLTHWKQYPPNTTKVYSYFESRGGKYDNTVFFGLQYLLKKYLEGKVVTQENIDEAYEISKLHLGNKDLFNKAGWEYILHEHNGHLPLSIKAVPEGTVVPTHNVLITVENTDPNCWWLTNYVETLLVQCWYPITVATQGREIKKLILKYLEKSGTPSDIDFKLHDFGFRGVSSVESAGIGGLAHLVNFKGSDTLEALVIGRRYYHCPMAGFSIPASEHSTITSWGKDHEEEAIFNMIQKYVDVPLRACVIDSFNTYNVCRNVLGDKLKNYIINNMNGTLVARPDSGDPAQVDNKVVKLLAAKFGCILNDKKYRVLNPKIRVIQGDGVNYDSINEIEAKLLANNWSSDNIGFGMGGANLQKVDRDTQKFAFKCSYIEGQSAGCKWNRDVWKDPITDKGKVSKRGKLFLYKNDDGEIVTANQKDWSPAFIEANNMLVEVFKDGMTTKEYTFAEIRERAKID